MKTGVIFLVLVLLGLFVVAACCFIAVYWKRKRRMPVYPRHNLLLGSTQTEVLPPLPVCKGKEPVSSSLSSDLDDDVSPHRLTVTSLSRNPSEDIGSLNVSKSGGLSYYFDSSPESRRTLADLRISTPSGDSPLLRSKSELI